jgi:hypothetical protein
MNYPKVEKTTGTDVDYQIKPADGWTVKEKGQRAEATQPSPQSWVVLDCYDYGGWTALMATAELSDGRTVVGRVKGGTHSAQLDIPKDDNHNHIADCWEEAWSGSTDATSDTDSLPRGNDVEGDGLSLYEEYRGFRCMGVHTRTDPIHKDLFVCDPGNLSPAGLALFGTSGITVHLVREDEFDPGAESADPAENETVINCNRGYAALGPQHLLYLRAKSLPGLDGLAEGSGPGTPRQTAFVSIDVDHSNARGEPGVPAVVAHEMAHGCNVWHHGAADYQAYDVQLRVDGNWVPLYSPGEGDTKNHRVAAQQGQTSGVQECFIRYNTASLYAQAEGGWRWHKAPGAGEWIPGSLYPDLPAGTLYCAQNKGTGVNGESFPGGSVAGDASLGVGNCLHQFQVNDLKPATVPGARR